jgi:hypothetical protein
MRKTPDTSAREELMKKKTKKTRGRHIKGCKKSVGNKENIIGRIIITYIIIIKILKKKSITLP